jgi:predicted AlkP superfamily phosphohydrolase/phosphomutase
LSLISFERGREEGKVLMNKNKVLVIGLDGATLDIIIPWASQGRLPVLNNILQSGVFGRLRSTIPAITPTAWASFMTGKNPGKHGIFSFGVRLKDRYRQQPVNASMIKGKLIWDILGMYGKKVGMFNIPLTYPPRPVNGFMVTGMFTPSVNTTFTYPAELASELIAEIKDYVIDVKWAEYKDKGVDIFLKDLRYATQKRKEAFLYLMNKYDWDFLMGVFIGMDRVQHCLWKYIDPELASPVSKEIYSGIVDYYQYLDEAIGEVIKNAEDECNIILMSDHGFTSLYKTINIEEILMDMGMLVMRSQKGKGWRDYIVPLVRPFRRQYDQLLKIANILGLKKKFIEQVEGMSSFHGGIDWSKTKAYGISSGIFINLKGREPLGIVEPGKEYEIVRDEIISRLMELRDTERDCNIFEHVYKKEELYHGDELEHAPDIMVLSSRSHYLAWASDTSKESAWRTGNHAIDGIIMAMGKNIQKNYEISNAEIIDIAPTILYMFGLAIPDDMDGKVLKDMFKKEYIDKHPVEYKSYTGDEIYVEAEMSAEDTKKVQDTLKGLGYW